MNIHTPFKVEIIPKAIMTMPEIRLIIQSCFNLNLFRKILILVLNVYHQSAAPAKTPHNTEEMAKEPVSALMLRPTNAKSPRIRKSALGLEMVRAATEIKSSNLRLLKFA